MKKTKLFITLIIATMMLFVSCAEKPEPVEEIKTATDYLSNKFIYGLMDARFISEGMPKDDEMTWVTSLMFDENANALNLGTWMIEDFACEEKEMKYSVSYKVVQLDSEGLSNGHALSYDYDIDVVNSTLAKLSGTVEILNTDMSPYSMSIDGPVSISDLPQKWLTDSTWNFKGSIHEGSSVLNSYLLAMSNCLILNNIEISANAKYANGVYSLSFDISTENIEQKQTINVYNPTVNDYEFVYETITTQTSTSIDEVSTIFKETIPVTATRIDKLPLWAADYASLKNDEMMVELPLEHDAIESKRLECAIVNNGDDSFTYIIYESESSFDDMNRKTTTKYKTYYRVNKTADGINANCKKVSVASDGKETQVGDSYSIALEAISNLIAII